MKVYNTDFEGLKVIEPDVHGDARGYFVETYSEARYEREASTPKFVQDNESLSRRGVLRGLHFQRAPYEQAKLVRCVRGCVLDVVLDMREGSATRGRYFAIELSGDNHLQLFIPKGFAHGYAVLTDESVFQYKCDEYYHPDSEGGFYALDPALGIDWHLAEDEIIMSEKDKIWPHFR